MSKKKSPAPVPDFSCRYVPPKSSSRKISVAMEMINRGNNGAKNGL
jgi:hypothetical protein